MGIIIIGAGVVGLTTAIGLAKAGHSVTILDRAPCPTDIDNRLFAITRASEHLLKAYDAWPAEDAHPYTAVEVWDQEGGAEVHWNADEAGELNLGYMVPHSALWNALWETAQQLAIKAQWHCTLVEAQKETTGWVLKDIDGRHWHTPLLIGADGAQSWVREALGFSYTTHHYGQMAIVADVKMVDGVPGTAYQRFSSEGPLGFLPRIAAQQWSIVWSMPTTQARAYMDLSIEAFEEALWIASDQRLGACTLESPRGIFPLRRLEASVACAHAVLIGDAAHTVHPLAGQGVNIGLYDAGHLVKVIEKAEYYGIPLGDATVLSAYVRRCQGYHRTMQWGIAGIKSVFENTHPGVVWARNQGMDWLDNMPQMKKVLAQGALGIFGE